MIQAEYIRSLNCNYERIVLEQKPEEKRYQYCILSRGGIKGLLPCGLRYINGTAYLYYDISSKQNVAQMYGNRCVDREWVKDFFWSVGRMRRELERFLLDGGNVLMFPDQIFQELESKVFYFLYIPYYQEDSGFGTMMEFLVEHIDYEDEKLVECVYHMYEQWERNGETYLQEKIFEDAKLLQAEEKNTLLIQLDAEEAKGWVEDEEDFVQKNEPKENVRESVRGVDYFEQNTGGIQKEGKTEGRRGIRNLFEGKKARDKRMREEYQVAAREAVAGLAVAEETTYESEEYGRTMYMEVKECAEEKVHRLYTLDGKMLATIEGKGITIGKKREEVDLPLEESSVSRMHARIIVEKEGLYLEDLNSTNGTFKNGLRLQPYEKRRLDVGDEIKCGKVIMIFR